MVTKPRPSHHKGTVPVVKLAEEFGLPILYAENKARLNELFRGRPAKSQLAILIDFGIIISQPVIDYFPLGIVNSHFSVLPEWRGADPITFAILSGQAQTGVSLMLLVEALDEGPLLAFAEHPLTATVTAPQLTDELIALSHKLLLQTIPAYLNGSIKPVPQTATGRQTSYSRKLTKQDGVLDWHKPAARLEREVRAYLGWPRSRTTIGNTEVIVTKAQLGAGRGQPGSLWLEDKQLGVHTPDGVLIIDRLIPAGKKEMSAQAFLAGYNLN